MSSCPKGERDRPFLLLPEPLPGKKSPFKKLLDSQGDVEPVETGQPSTAAQKTCGKKI